MCVKPGGAKIQLSRDEPAKKKIVAGKGVGKKKSGGRGGGGRIFCDLESFLGCLGFRV